MPYEDAASIPPERHRRRSHDHINWSRVAKYVLLSMPVWGPGAWTGVGMALEVHRQWLDFQKLPARVNQLEQEVQEHEKLEQKISSLERYRCILGYDPGGKFGEKTTLPRERRSECRTPLPEAAAAAASVAP